MSVLIRGEDRERLTVMGDIEAKLRVPASADGRCWLSFSDGTLIEAAYGENDDCRFAVSEEGAGITQIRREGGGDVLRLDWRVEWVTVAAATNAARASRGERCRCCLGYSANRWRVSDRYQKRDANLQPIKDQS